MEPVSLECDFPVIGGQQGSLLGLWSVFTESRDGCSAFPASGGEGHSSWRCQRFLGCPECAAFGAAGQWDSLDLGLMGLKAGRGKLRSQGQECFVLPCAAVHPPHSQEGWLRQKHIQGAIVDPEHGCRCDLYSSVGLFLLFSSPAYPQSVRSSVGTSRVYCKVFPLPRSPPG